MPTLNFPFTNPANCTYDPTKIDISDGKAKLALQQDDADFTEDFADDTDFTYDSDLAEFSGGQVQQKDTRPVGATFYASYNTNINGNWGNGVLTGTAYNGAGITGNKLDLSGSLNKYVDYDADGNADSQQTGCIRFKWTPKYSGSGSFQYLFTLVEAVGNANNRIRIYHQSTLLFYVVSDSTGATIVSVAETFSPVADTEYEIELNWDVTTGATRLFIDGVQLGSTQTGTGTRSADIGLLRFGKDLNGNGNADFLIDDVLIFSTVQHTSNYTPDWSNIYENIYNETSVILPEMEHTGEGTIKLFNSFSTTEIGSPRYTLQIGRSGNYLYWNGSAWVISDGTYNQANDAITFNTNCGSLDVDGEDYGQFKIIFPDSNTQSKVDELTANMNVDIGYLTTNPTIEMITGFRTDDLERFTETSTKTGSDEIKYILKKGSSWYYWTGTAWAVSDGTYTQSNTASEIETNKASFVDESTECYVKLFLHSDDGTTSPEIDNLQIDFSYAGETPDTLNKCLVWGYTFDGEGNPLTDVIKIRLNKYIVQYGDYSSVLKNDDIEVTPDDTGYWEVELIENENMVSPDAEDVKYIFDFGDTNVFEKTVPNESTKAYNDLE